MDIQREIDENTKELTIEHKNLDGKTAVFAKGRVIKNTQNKWLPDGPWSLVTSSDEIIMLGGYEEGKQEGVWELFPQGHKAKQARAIFSKGKILEYSGSIKRIGGSGQGTKISEEYFFSDQGDLLEKHTKEENQTNVREVYCYFLDNKMEIFVNKDLSEQKPTINMTGRESKNFMNELQKTFSLHAVLKSQRKKMSVNPL